MKLEQFNKMKQDLTDKMWLEYQAEHKVFDEGNYKFNFNYTKEDYITSEELWETDPTSCINYILEFMREIAEYKGTTKEVQMYSDIENNKYSSKVESISYSCECTQFISKLNIDQFFEYFVKQEFKERIVDLLCPETITYKRNIDCKLMTLYKEGNIDWLTLQKLVYSNCEL